MAKKTLAGRAGSGAARQRSVVAATVRAAARKAEKAEKAERPGKAGKAGRTGVDDALRPPPYVAGRTLVVDADADADVDVDSDVDADPEPSPDSAPESAGDDLAPTDTDASTTGKTPQISSEGDSEERAAADESAESAAAPRRNRRPRATRSMRGLRGPVGLRFRSGPLRVLTALLTAAAVTGAVLLGLEYRDAQRTQQARTEAVAAARKAAPEILSYDHRHLTRDFKAARGHLTGGFATKYAKTTKTVVAPTAKKYQGVVKATVAEPPGGEGAAVSVVSASPEKVVVLLFLNQVTENSELKQPRVDLNRVRMTMVKESGGWKASALEAL